jgi:hypothetical protein
VTRRWLRWVRPLLILGACAAVLVALAHSLWVRGVVLDRLTAGLRARTGFEFSASRLDYNLLRLTAEVRDLRISRPGDAGAPILSVRRLSIALTQRSLSGALDAAAIEADGVSLVIDFTKSADPPAPFVVPVFTLGRVSVRHLDIEVINPDGIGSLAARNVSLDATGG